MGGMNNVRNMCIAMIYFAKFRFIKGNNLF